MYRFSSPVPLAIAGGALLLLGVGCGGSVSSSGGDSGSPNPDLGPAVGPVAETTLLTYPSIGYSLGQGHFGQEGLGEPGKIVCMEGKVVHQVVMGSSSSNGTHSKDELINVIPAAVRKTLSFDEAPFAKHGDSRSTFTWGYSQLLTHRGHSINLQAPYNQTSTSALCGDYWMWSIPVQRFDGSLFSVRFASPEKAQEVTDELGDRFIPDIILGDDPGKEKLARLLLDAGAKLSFLVFTSGLTAPAFQAVLDKTQCAIGKFAECKATLDALRAVQESDDRDPPIVELDKLSGAWGTFNYSVLPYPP
jgi:hypothetical protein